MIEQMAIAIAFPGFNDLGRSVTHMFLLMDHCLYRFSMFSDKMEKIYRAKGWIFCQTHLEFRSLFTFRSSVRPFQMPLEGLSLGITFAIIYATDPLLQNMTKILFASFDSPSIFLTMINILLTLCSRSVLKVTDPRFSPFDLWPKPFTLGP